MEPVCFSETLASTDKTAWRQNPEECHHPPHRRENLKPHNSFERSNIKQCRLLSRRDQSVSSHPQKFKYINE
jgi:hypothetical protein